MIQFLWLRSWQIFSLASRSSKQANATYKLQIFVSNLSAFPRLTQSMQSTRLCRHFRIALRFCDRVYNNPDLWLKITLLEAHKHSSWLVGRVSEEWVSQVARFSTWQRITSFFFLARNDKKLAAASAMHRVSSQLIELYQQAEAKSENLKACVKCLIELLYSWFLGFETNEWMNERRLS